MLAVNGESAIGNITGIAMAWSEVLLAPLPSVEEPKGTDMPTKREKELTADNLFYRVNSQARKRLNTCFTLEP